MLKGDLYGYEIHQNLINYDVSIVKSGEVVKGFNPRRWLTVDEAKETLSKEIDEIRKS